jgi:hypothetical protein
MATITGETTISEYVEGAHEIAVASGNLPEAFPASLAITIVMECMVGAQQLLIEGWYDTDLHVQHQYSLDEAMAGVLYDAQYWQTRNGTEPVEMVMGALVKAMQQRIEQKSGTGHNSKQA